MTWGKWVGVLALFVLVLFLAGAASASCAISISDTITELRSNTDGYDTSISAENNSPIDIRISFTIDDLSGTDCNGNIRAKAVVYRYNENTDTWESFRTTTTKSQTLDEDDFVFIWDNEFNAQSTSTYNRYRVEGKVLDNNSAELESENAFVDVQDNSCAGIILNVNDITMSEDDSVDEIFEIENNTNTEFDISSLQIYFSNSLITSGSADYDTTVYDHDTTDVDVTLDSGSVSSDTTITGSFRVAGYLGSTYCSATTIGYESFDVTVENDGGGSTPDPSSDCDDLELTVHDFTMNEGSESQQTFYLKNNSTKRFEVLDVQLTQNGLALQDYFTERYAFAGELADIVVKATAGNVFQNKLFENRIKVKGVFSDGKSCSYDNIESKTFNASIIDSTGSASFGSCANFSISAPGAISVENFGKIPITITNGTNGRATIYVESALDVSPTIISLPGNSSVSREIVVSISGTNGEVTLRPDVEGCSIPATRVLVNNTARGNLSAVTITSAVVRDANTGIITLHLTINNLTNRVYTGNLSFSAPQGWVINDRMVTIVPGTNIVDLPFGQTSNATQGTGTATFSANGESISTTFTMGGDVFGGFFGFGIFGLTAIGAIILIIIIAIIIVAIVAPDYYAGSQEDEVWVERKM